MISLLKGNKTERNKALEAIYRANRDRICAYVVANSGTEAEATDLFQESMIAFYENVKKGTFKGDSAISTYLYSIAKYKWLNQLKKNQVRSGHHAEAASDQSETKGHLLTLMDEERKDLIQEIIGLLGFDCKYILIESIYHNTPMKEIASEGKFTNEQIVRNKKYKCLKKLRDLMVARPGLLKIIESDE